MSDSSTMPTLIDLDNLKSYNTKLQKLVSDTYATQASLTSNIEQVTTAIGDTNTTVTNLNITLTNADATLENSLDDLSDSVDGRFETVNTDIGSTNTNLGNLSSDFTNYKASNDTAVGNLDTELDTKCNEPVIVIKTLEEDLAKETAFEVSEHTVNSTRLQVFMDGVLCHLNVQYKDVSTTEITFTSDLAKGTEITTYLF